jgi:hypothetical protein
VARSSDKLRERAQDGRGEWINLAKLKCLTEQFSVRGALCSQRALMDCYAVD